MSQRILLVEDDASVLKVTKARLEHTGYEVVTAMDGEEALAKVAANGTIDLILLDIKLPKLDGFEVCRRLKASLHTAKIPILLFTASSDRWQRLTEQCLELGIQGWLRKPFRSNELLDKIRQALGEEGRHHG